MVPNETAALPSGFSSRVDELFAPWARSDSPGAVVAVRHRGRDVHRGSYGMAHLAHPAPLTDRSVMRIGSQTKQFTVLLALMLESQGRLSFQDDVRMHLPWLPEFARPLTLHHLAANVSGLRDYVEILELSGQSPLTPCPRQMIRQVIRDHAGANFMPGDDMLYCNGGFFLLYEVIEQVSGRRYGDLLSEWITGPLGMHCTQMMLHDDEILPHLVDHHTRGPDGRWRRAWTGEETNGDGGIVSSADDMLNWLSHLNSPRLGGAELTRMTRPGAIISGVPSPYCLGLIATDYRGDRNIGHSGSMAGARSEGVRFPDRELDIVILANTDEISPFSMARRIVDIAQGRPAASPHSSAARSRLSAAAGLYHDAASDDVFAIVVEGDVPLLRTNSGTHEIEEISSNLFAPEFGVLPLRFGMRSDGDIEAIRLGRRRLYRRIRNGELAGNHDIVGCYGDAPLGLFAEISLEGDLPQLRIKSKFADRDSLLHPIAPNLLLARSASAADAGAAVGAGHTVPSWLCVVRTLPDAIIINTQWTRYLRLPRIAGPI